MNTDRTPVTVVDGSIVVHADMTREHAARLVRALTDALVHEGTVPLEIRIYDRTTSFTTGERVGNVNISTRGDAFYGGDAVVTDSHITHRDMDA